MITIINTNVNTTFTLEYFTKSFMLIVPNEKKIKYGINSYGKKIKSVEIMNGYSKDKGSTPRLNAKDVMDAGSADSIAVGVNRKLTPTPNNAVTNVAPVAPTELTTGDR